MDTRLIAAMGGGSPTPPIGPRRGQLVITGPFPFGPHPFASDNPFFMDEIEHVMLSDEARILDAYQALGMNETIIGPAFTQRGYDGQYPATDWRHDDILGVCEELQRRGIRITLALLPDCSPYFDGYEWDLANYERDFGTIISQVGAYASRVQLAWEVVTKNDKTCEAIAWARNMVPNVPIYWHNPPGHLSPGTSDEDEQACWRNAAAAGIAGLAEQAAPPSSTDTDRPPIEQMQYDLWDLVRRFRGDSGSPWGGPFFNCDGKMLEVWWREGVAYDIYHQNCDQPMAHVWAQAALSVDGVKDSGDGA